MSINWDAYKPEVVQLYVEGKKTAEQTIKYLNDKYGVGITIRKFKTQYGNLKKLQAKEWQAVFQEIRNRKAEGKDSEVYLFGRRLDQSRVNRARRRYGKGIERVVFSQKLDKNRLDVRTPVSQSENLADESDNDDEHLDPRDNESQKLLGLYPSLDLFCHGNLVLSCKSPGKGNPIDTNRNDHSPRVLAGGPPTNNQQSDQVNCLTGPSSSDTNVGINVGAFRSVDLQGVVDVTDPVSLDFFSQNIDSMPEALDPTDQIDEQILQYQAKLPKNFFTLSPPNRIIRCLPPQFGSFWASEVALEIFPQLRLSGTFPTTSSYQFDETEILGTTGLLVSHLARVDPALHVLRPIATIVEYITTGPHQRRGHDLLQLIKMDENTLHQIFTLLAYLASNDILPSYKIRNFVKWVVKSGHTRKLSSFLQKSSSELLGTRIFIVKILEAICVGDFVKLSEEEELDIFKTQPREAFNLLLAADRRIFSGLVGVRLLVQASDADHLTAVKLLVDRGVDVNGLSSKYPIDADAADPWTPLSRAAMNGSEELIRFLIQSGALVNKQIPHRNQKKTTALELAVEFQRVDAVAALLSGVATSGFGQENLEISNLTPLNIDDFNPSLLVKAAEEGRESFLKFLLVKRIVDDEVLERTLYHAVLENNVRALSTLTCLGVDPNARKYRVRLSKHIVDDATGFGGSASDESDDDESNEDESDIESDVETTSEIDNERDVDELDREEFDSTNPILLALGHRSWELINSQVYWMRRTPMRDYYSWKASRTDVDDRAEYMAYLLTRAGARLSLKALHRKQVDIEVNFCHILAKAGQDMSLIGVDVLEHEATQGNLYSCAALLDMGVSIDAYGKRGLSGLQAAAGGGHLTLIEFFLDRGADINLPACCHGGHTVLQAAAKRGDPALINYLVDAGADITAPPAKKNGETVLEAVAGLKNLGTHGMGDRVNMFGKLLKLGALINRPRNGDQVLHRLVENDDIVCLRLAIQAGARIEGWQPRSSRFRGTPLHVAAKHHNEEAIRLLLDHGADINAQSARKSKSTPLKCAVNSNNMKSISQRRLRAVQLLLSHGAKINTPAGPKFGRTALQSATSCQSPGLDIISLLLEQGADVNAKPSMEGGLTALQGAAISGEIHIARLLLEHGAEINAAAAPKWGRTAVEGAAEHGRLDMVRFLLQMGARPDPMTGFSKAIKLAMRHGHWGVVDLLQESQDIFNSLAASYGNSSGSDFGNCLLA